MRMTEVLYIFLSLICIRGVDSYSFTTEAALRSLLYTGYEVKSRPSTNVAVTLTFMPIALNELNIKSETMTMTGYYTLTWTDSRLDWSANPTYSSINEIYTTSVETWRPTLIITNSVSAVGIINDEGNPIRVEDNGRVIWSQPLLLKTVCECDPTFYPFDTQKCGIILSTWSLSATEVLLQFHRRRVLMEYYQENGEWEYLSFETSITAENRDARFYSMSNVYFKFRRRPQFVVFNTIIPMILLAFMSCLTFYVSIESGEKIGYCLTVMLAYAVYLTIVSDSMPTTSVKTSALSVYLVVILVFDVASCPLTLFIINCHHRPEDEPVPHWIKLMTSCFKVATCQGKQSCCKSGKVSNEVTEKTKKESTEIGDNINWVYISGIWDVFFLRFYIVSVTIVTLGFIAVLLYGYYLEL